jgi:hypothetical protein
VSSLSLVSLAEVCHARGFVRPSSFPGSRQTEDHGGQIAAVGIDPRRSRRPGDRSTRVNWR